MDAVRYAMEVKAARAAIRMELKFPALSEWFAGQDTESVRRVNTRVAARQRQRGYRIRPGFGASARLRGATAQQVMGAAGSGINRPRGTLRLIGQTARAGSQQSGPGTPAVGDRRSSSMIADNSKRESGSSAYTPTPTAPDRSPRARNTEQTFGGASVIKRPPRRRYRWTDDIPRHR